MPTVMPTLPLQSNNIGRIYTPPIWARWLIEKWDILPLWLQGASVCDPTAGEGVFILTLLAMAKSQGVVITGEMLSRISLYDIAPAGLILFKKNVQYITDVLFPDENITCCDIIINTPKKKFDILVGNPPWANFSDLHTSYKDTIKPHFIEAGLVVNKKLLLLGSARIDIAALIVNIVIGNMLNKNGTAYFYTPLSLFCGNDAHQGFRNYVSNGRPFAVSEVWEFSKTKIFDNVSTAYCCTKFSVDTKHVFPVRFYRERASSWERCFALPLVAHNDTWCIKNEDMLHEKNTTNIKLSQTQKPRQGVNTCGANGVFIFSEKPTFLPSQYVFPLATKELWKCVDIVPHKWVFIPHNTLTGKPLALHEIKMFPEMYDYVLRMKDTLVSRKGVLIQTSIKKGLWWALFGVGSYSFTPYKVLWQAYGKHIFVPQIVSHFAGQPWQANQAMHAYIPCETLENAESIISDLGYSSVQKVLSELNGGGRCNWAQPGKMKKILMTPALQQGRLAREYL